MLENLPDFPVIKKVAEALWRQDSRRHGTAVMIGSGFSRCAARHVDGNKKLPLWKDFAKSLANQLKGNNQDYSFSDPLRLAEEYRAYFGQAALNDLIKTEINDQAWQPGNLYQDLLTLPWAEVLTTNWDTLLERAALAIHSPIYGTVSKQTDLSRVRSPRIVKLHGSINVTEQFIVAQEDYRKYPKEFAAYVNFARQVFIENELCLIGFSGDDPNFLQWAGWVRDHLADQARRIYLVGALNLSAANRKFLESINIAPIDLWEAVKEYDDSDSQHMEATKLFLKELLRQKPEPQHKWTPGDLHSLQMSHDEHMRIYKDHDYAATLLKSQLGAIQRDRESYPGWLVCPPNLQWKLHVQITHPQPSKNNLAALDSISREKLLYEIAWRYGVTYQSISPWMLEELKTIADPTIDQSLSKRQQMEVALLLLKSARRNGSQVDFDVWVSSLEKYAQHLPDCSAEVAYQKGLMALNNLDYPRIEAEIKNIEGEDPIWKIKRASLLSELGRLEESTLLVAEAYKDLLERSRHDANSIRINSRLAWVYWLHRAINFLWNSEGIEGLQQTFKTLRCDPWDFIEHIRDKASKRQADYYKSQETIEPLFEQGHYRDNSTAIQFTSETEPFLLLDGLADSVGVPLRWGSAGLISGAAEQLVTSEDSEIELAIFTLAIRVANGEDAPAIKHIFSRINLAKTSQTLIATLHYRLMAAIVYWRKLAVTGSGQQKRHAVDRLRIFIEILARLSVRLHEEDAKKLFALAIDLGRDAAIRDFWLFEALNHLITYSLKSIPSTQHPGLLLDALSFPLPSEAGIDGSPHSIRWPNPVVEIVGNRESNFRLDARIEELINLCGPATQARSTILLRLLPLIRGNFLTNRELDNLASRLWTGTDYKALPHADLYGHVWVVLPAIDRPRVNSLLSDMLFELGDNVVFTSAHLYAIAGAAKEKNPIFPTPVQARNLFDRLVSWRPQKEKKDSLGFDAGAQSMTIDALGNAISHSIVPSLDFEDRNQDRFQKLEALYKEAGVHSLINAYPYFSGLDSVIFESIERTIRKQLQGPTANEVGWAAQALYRWKTLSTEAKQVIPAPSDKLISRVIYLIESGRTVGLQSLLWHARQILNDNLLPQADIDLLIECLPYLFDATDYANIRPRGREAVSITLIREECIRLAKKITKEHKSPKLDLIVEQAKADALPEVRFAAKDLESLSD